MCEPTSTVLVRLRNAQLRLLLEDASTALKEAMLTASWLCTDENMELLDNIEDALNADKILEGRQGEDNSLPDNKKI